MAQGTEFPLRKPPGFHYDFFLLGITTFIAGLLGVPAPNGLIPQAPIHTTSLLVMGPPAKDDIETPPDSMQVDDKHQSLVQKGDANEDRNYITRTHSRVHPPRHSDLEPDPTPMHDGIHDVRPHEVPVAVVEQRVSNLAQGALCLVLLTGPFLHVLGLIPRGVLAGLL